MIDQDTTSQKARSTHKFSGKAPLAYALAGAVGLGLLGAALSPSSSTAITKANAAQNTVKTPLGNAPMSFADLAESVSPAVVSIQVKNGGKKSKVARKNSPEFNMPNLPDGHPLNEFFKKFRKEGPGGDARPRPSMGQGSGFIISEDGYVVTNHHVVDSANKITVVLDGGDDYEADVIGTDERTDLALLKIKSKKKFQFVEFADETARVGDWVVAVGNPFGLGGTVTAGIVSAHKRDIGNGPYDFLQIDAAVNRGNSGGPAFSLNGKVVGVNTAIFSPSGGNVGIAFAVPAKLAKSVVAQLKSEGKVARGWLGVTIQTVSEDMAESFGLKEPQGALVTNLSKKGPAAKSDMEVGDLILSVDGEKIENSRDLARKIATYNPNKSVKIKVLRDGDEQDISVKLGNFPSGKQLAALSKGNSAPSSDSEEMEGLGLSIAPASTTPGAGKKGVVITEVDPDSRAAEKGLKAGDVILKVGGSEVSQPDDVTKSVRKAKDKGRAAVNMLVRSGDNQRFIALPLKKV